MRLLIVEDENRIVEILTDNFRKAGFTVDAVSKGSHGLDALRNIPYDAVILDLGLPDFDGIELLKQIRHEGMQVPVLILTALDAIEDRVKGLDLGADDYLVKPFAAPELISRIKALLRRPGGALGSVLTAGNVAMDTLARDTQVDSHSVELSRRETALLENLMRRLGRVVSKELLEEKLYGLGEELESNAVAVHVHHLRRKLEKAGASTQIHTVRGVGYILAEEKS